MKNINNRVERAILEMQIHKELKAVGMVIENRAKKKLNRVDC